MKQTKITLVTIIAIIIASCSIGKKSLSTKSAEVPANPITVKKPINTFLLKPVNGIYEPGIEELKAIQLQYKETTLQQLKYGHAIYTEGACIKCHDALNIYVFDEIKWKDIVDNMAVKAMISDEQKDAVYKYVLSIKAKQPKKI